MGGGGVEIKLKNAGVPTCFTKQIAVFVGHPSVSNTRAVDLWLFSKQSGCNVLITSDKSSCFLKHRSMLAASGEPKTLGIVAAFQNILEKNPNQPQKITIYVLHLSLVISICLTGRGEVHALCLPAKTGLGLPSCAGCPACAASVGHFEV